MHSIRIPFLSLLFLSIRLTADILNMNSTQFLLKVYSHYANDGTFHELNNETPSAVGYVFAQPYPLPTLYSTTPVCQPGIWPDFAAAAACRQTGFAGGVAFTTGGNSAYPRVQLHNTQLLRIVSCPPAALSLKDCTATLTPNGLCRTVASAACYGRRLGLREYMQNTRIAGQCMVNAA